MSAQKSKIGRRRAMLPMIFDSLPCNAIRIQLGCSIHMPFRFYCADYCCHRDSCAAARAMKLWPCRSWSMVRMAWRGPSRVASCGCWRWQHDDLIAQIIHSNLVRPVRPFSRSQLDAQLGWREPNWAEILNRAKKKFR